MVRAKFVVLPGISSGAASLGRARIRGKGSGNKRGT